MLAESIESAVSYEQSDLFGHTNTFYHCHFASNFAFVSVLSNEMTEHLQKEMGKLQHTPILACIPSSAAEHQIECGIQNGKMFA